VCGAGPLGFHRCRRPRPTPFWEKRKRNALRRHYERGTAGRVRGADRVGRIDFREFGATGQRRLHRLAANIDRSRRALDTLTYRVQRAGFRTPNRATRNPRPGICFYFVTRCHHTGRGTFRATLTPVPPCPGVPPVPASADSAGPITIETPIDCWWAWRHPNMLAAIVGRRGGVFWLDFFHPEAGRLSEPFAGHAERYERARAAFLGGEGGSGD
jgi:hypothetical protein